MNSQTLRQGQPIADPQVSVPMVQSPQREKVTVLIISSPEGVRENIHDLHQKGYADAGLWSGLLPTPNPGEVMSILVRYRLG